eukprot:m.56621 g.56621  ORF g.56621 m.56621 type:complete len:169 (+) comp7806_c0_seq2:104-610(+)
MSHFQQEGVVREVFSLLIKGNASVEEGKHVVDVNFDSDRLESMADLGLLLLGVLGYDPPYDVIEQLYHTYSSSSKGGLSLNDCFKIIQGIHSTSFFGDQQMWFQAFLTLDSKGKGFLSEDDFVEHQQEMFPHLSDTGLRLAFRRMDEDGDGRLSLRNGTKNGSFKTYE